MEKLYTVRLAKIRSELTDYKFALYGIDVNGDKMDVFFCNGEKGMFVIAGKSFKGKPHRTLGRWYSGSMFYDVYFRKNFKNREEGNEFYKNVIQTKKIV